MWLSRFLVALFARVDREKISPFSLYGDSKYGSRVHRKDTLAGYRYSPLTTPLFTDFFRH